MARQYHRQSGSPERYKTISFYRSYHGATMGALTSTGWPQLEAPYEPFLTGGIHAHAPIPGSCRACTGSCTLGCLAQLRDVIEQEGPRTVSAIIVEPVMLTAGVQALSDGVPARPARALRRDGRAPDLRRDRDRVRTARLLVRRGAGGRLAGHPLRREGPVERVRADLGRPAHGEGRPRLLGQRRRRACSTRPGTRSPANPVSAACGLAVIRYFEEHGVLDNVRARGAELEARLREIAERYPIAGELRGRGLLYCLDFIDPATGGPLAPDPAGRDRRPAGGPAARAARSRLSPQRDPRSAARPHGGQVTEIADLFEESVAEVDRAGRLGRRRRPRRRVRPVRAAPPGAEPARARRDGSLVEAATEAISSRILHGQLAPGDRLPTERELTEQLGVSRTVLREALSSLEALGLLETRGTRGRWVAAGGSSERSRTLVGAWLHQHAREILEVDEIRSVLEAQAIRSMSEWDAIDAAREARTRSLAAQTEALERGDARRRGDGDAAFHRDLGSYTQNEALRALAARASSTRAARARTPSTRCPRPRRARSSSTA